MVFLVPFCPLSQSIFNPKDYCPPNSLTPSSILFLFFSSARSKIVAL